MQIVTFLEEKTQQLSFYLRAFWEQAIDYRELELFFWDTLEEWSQVSYPLDYPYSSQERVFWHVLHQMHFWGEEKLRHDVYLLAELSNCILFLEGRGHCPFDCIGIRP